VSGIYLGCFSYVRVGLEYRDIQRKQRFKHFDSEAAVADRVRIENKAVKVRIEKIAKTAKANVERAQTRLDRLL